MKFCRKTRNWLFIIGAIPLLILVAFKAIETESDNFPVSKYYGYDTSVRLRGSVYIAIDTTDFTTLAINRNSVLNDAQIAIMIPKEPKNINWYDAKHRNAPLDKVYQDGPDWHNTYLK